MILQSQLDEWTTAHARAMARIHWHASTVMDADPGTTIAASALNSVNGACADLAMLSARCQDEIRDRYDESAAAGRPKPLDAQEAVAHFRGLRELTQTMARHIKAECRHWAAGTWALKERKEVMTERINRKKGTP